MKHAAHFTIATKDIEDKKIDVHLKTLSFEMVNSMRQPGRSNLVGIQMRSDPRAEKARPSMRRSSREN